VKHRVLGDSAVAAKIARLEAVEAIRRLIHEVSQSFDRRELNQFLSNWHSDPVWYVAPGYEAIGLEAIRAIAETSWSTMKTTHHWTCNELIDVDGDWATGIVEVNALAQAQDGMWHQSPATYHDRYVRVGGTWKLAERRATIHGTLSVASASTGHPWGDIESR
jgi:ketosteroid isomerase-like protein